jgi:HEAT repeat protein
MKSSGYDVIDMAALESVAAGLARGPSWCDLGSYELIATFRPSMDVEKDLDYIVVILLDRNRESFVRAMAAESLGEMGSVAVPALTALKAAESDSNADVRRAAHMARRRIVGSE